MDNDAPDRQVGGVLAAEIARVRVSSRTIVHLSSRTLRVALPLICCARRVVPCCTKGTGTGSAQSTQMVVFSAQSREEVGEWFFSFGRREIKEDAVELDVHAKWLFLRRTSACRAGADASTLAHPFAHNNFAASFGRKPAFTISLLVVLHPGQPPLA